MSEKGSERDIRQRRFNVAASTACPQSPRLFHSPRANEAATPAMSIIAPDPNAAPPAPVAA